MSVEELKELQLKIIRKSKKINIIGISVAFIIILMTILCFIRIGSYTIIDWGLFIIIFELIFFSVIITVIKTIVVLDDEKFFKKEFKNTFVLSLLREYFDNLTYDPEKGFDEKYIQYIGMLDTGDRFYSNDYVSGKYKNIKVEQSDIEVEEEYEENDSNGEQKWITIFLGKWMTFDFNKKFKANMRITNNYFNAGSLPSDKNFSKIEMEDEEFNQMFEIYTEIEHDAFYILTPHFMEKMKNVTKKLNCGIMFCFIDEKLHIAINNDDDSFEWDVYKIIDEEKIRKNILEDIELIINFINDLNLDNDLFKEEE